MRKQRAKVDAGPDPVADHLGFDHSGPCMVVAHWIVRLSKSTSRRRKCENTSSGCCETGTFTRCKMPQLPRATLLTEISPRNPNDSALVSAPLVTAHGKTAATNWTIATKRYRLLGAWHPSYSKQSRRTFENCGFDWKKLARWSFWFLLERSGYVIRRPASFGNPDAFRARVLHQALLNLCCYHVRHSLPPRDSRLLETSGGPDLKVCTPPVDPFMIPITILSVRSEHVSRPQQQGSSTSLRSHPGWFGGLWSSSWRNRKLFVCVIATTIFAS
jgi:hypothetical protein